MSKGKSGLLVVSLQKYTNAGSQLQEHTWKRNGCFIFLLYDQTELLAWWITTMTISLSLCRPICGVAGIQSSQSTIQHHVQHPTATPVALSHCPHSGGAGAFLTCRSQLDNPSAMLMAPSPQAQQAQEQNGILDWLRKLRLHKYYPVFQQLTMEEVRVRRESLSSCCVGLVACVLENAGGEGI